MKKSLRLGICLAIPFVLVLCILFVDLLVSFVQLLDPCPLWSITGIYCPACGATRGVSALFKGDVVTSLRYNVWIVFSFVLGLGLYAEFVLKTFGIRIKIIPKNDIFIYTVLGLSVIYFIVRNLIPNLIPAT